MITNTESATLKSSTKLPLIALAFGRKGNLLGGGKVKENTAYFTLDELELRNARVFILPKPDDDNWLKGLNLKKAEQLAAFEPHLRFNAKGGIVFDQIPSDILSRWTWKRCYVRGRITNRASVEGQLETFPVCNATVHICEVDRWWNWIERIPRDLLERLRHGLVERIPLPRPIPTPLPGNGPRLPFLPPPVFPTPPPVFGPGPVQNLQVTNFENDFVLPLAERNELVNRLQLQNAAQFRVSLREEYLNLRPYFCYFPYLWPYLYSCEQVATVQTDNNGRYEARFWHQERNPDVYVWIEYPFPGGLQTVYRPNIVCSTHWDYDCGSEINIRLSDNRIPPVCGERLVGRSVAIRAIGSSASPLTLEQNMTAQTSVPGNNNFRTVGLSSFATSDLGFSLANKHVRPYTSDFSLIAQFGDGLIPTGIHYFQVEYRRISNEVLAPLIDPTNKDTGWLNLNSGAINRTYVVQQGLDFKYFPYSLGPFSVNEQQVYRVPPQDPQLNGVDGEPASTDSSARWTQYDRVTIGRIKSDKLEGGDGLYQFRIRFLNGSGEVANVNDAFFRVPNPLDPTETTVAPPAYICTEDDHTDFQFLIRIDTAPTNVAIEGVTLDRDTDAMSDCGFVEYTDTNQQVGLTFVADHPRDFATFNFNLERGRRLAITDTFALGDAAGMVSGHALPYELGSDGKYRANFTVASLVEGCGGKAAFSESLSIRGLHTDGHHAGVFFRRSVNNSFALAPQLEEATE